MDSSFGIGDPNSFELLSVARRRAKTKDTGNKNSTQVTVKGLKALSSPQLVEHSESEFGSDDLDLMASPSPSPSSPPPPPPKQYCRPPNLNLKDLSFKKKYITPPLPVSAEGQEGTSRSRIVRYYPEFRKSRKRKHKADTEDEKDDEEQVKRKPKLTTPTVRFTVEGTKWAKNFRAARSKQTAVSGASTVASSSSKDLLDSSSSLPEPARGLSFDSLFFADVESLPLFTFPQIEANSPRRNAISKNPEATRRTVAHHHQVSTIASAVLTQNDTTKISTTSTDLSMPPIDAPLVIPGKSQVVEAPQLDTAASVALSGFPAHVRLASEPGQPSDALTEMQSVVKSLGEMTKVSDVKEKGKSESKEKEKLKGGSKSKAKKEKGKAKEKKIVKADSAPHSSTDSSCTSCANLSAKLSVLSTLESGVCYHHSSCSCNTPARLILGAEANLPPDINNRLPKLEMRYVKLSDMFVQQRVELQEKDAKLMEKDAKLLEKDEEIERLKARIEQLHSTS